MGVLCCPVGCSPGSPIIQGGLVSCLSALLRNPGRRGSRCTFRAVPGSAGAAWRKAGRCAACPGPPPGARGKEMPSATTSMLVVGGVACHPRSPRNPRHHPYYTLRGVTGNPPRKGAEVLGSCVETRDWGRITPSEPDGRLPKGALQALVQWWLSLWRRSEPSSPPSVLSPHNS